MLNHGQVKDEHQCRKREDQIERPYDERLKKNFLLLSLQHYLVSECAKQAKFRILIAKLGGWMLLSGVASEISQLCLFIKSF